ncbi:phytanoyl-CoA dioxygenase [Haloferula helveola]|uniref:Phytanoyl-CoA dioxygenase n=1 Tax=Haloferula helveola TaxID=490095 RepID=A0ABN6H7V4_9BACT|nr:phytanoyl-CoA dioxygenase [Haloferula helveola]
MRDGFQLLRGILPENELEDLREEADTIQKAAGKPCVRRLLAKSDRIRRLARDPRLLGLLPAPMTPVRSILFDKTSEDNWPVAWHQDLTITVSGKREIDGYGPWSRKDEAVHVQPPLEVLERMWTLRIHLDDTPSTNGALQVIPRSHSEGKLDRPSIGRWADKSPFVCECSAGDILLMSPLILHASAKSTAPSRRRILHFEYADPDTLDPRLSFSES